VTRSPVSPALSVVIPTFNNVAVLTKNIECWRQVAADQPVELVVIEDGCRDATAEYLRTVAGSEWGARHVRWHHQNDLHELRCTNYGLRDARAPLAMAWQDDMFLRAAWLVPEIIATFAAYPDLGLLCLSRGLDCFPLDEPIATWEDLIDERRLRSTIGPRPLNWFRLQEVDSVIRPWVVRRACLDAVGFLDEAFVPTEWDEADLCFRIRKAGWRVATHGYERVGAYEHLGSTTIGAISDAYKARVLKNGRLFHERWDDAIRAQSGRSRKTWRRRMSVPGWWWTASKAAGVLAGSRRTHAPVRPGEN
jgi:glycosyltransferase involved in cell wall biosynthesis